VTDNFKIARMSVRSVEAELNNRDSELERLRVLLRVCMRRWIPFAEVEFRRTVMEAAHCNENGDEP
jgi:hypothetical protein